jgi:peroxiredoxin Q/BCP
MRRSIALGLLAGALTTGVAAPAAAQNPAPPLPASTLLKVGDMAPDFSLVGTTRYGVLANPVKLSDYRGETVILAFFFRVRTPG